MIRLENNLLKQVKNNMELTYFSGFLIVFITYTILYVLYCKYLHVTVEDRVAEFVDHFWDNFLVNLLLSIGSWVSIFCIVGVLLCVGIYFLVKYIINKTKIVKILIYIFFG